VNPVEQLVGQLKVLVMQMLNETADEFDEKDLTPEQRQTYNDFTGVFGNKILSLRLEEPIGVNHRNPDNK
jgi:hypothetical protein